MHRATSLLILLAVSAGRAAPPAWVTAAAQTPLPGTHVAAILLQDSAVNYLSSDRVHHRVRYAYRMLSDQVRASAWFRYPYNPDISQIQTANAWIISADGAKTHVYHRTDFLDIGSPDGRIMWNHNRILAFNGGERLHVGETMVCELESEDPAGVFEVEESFQRTLFTVEHSFEVTPPAGMQLIWHATSKSLPSPTPGSLPGSLRWEQKLRAVPRDLEPPKSFLPNPEAIVVRTETPNQPMTWPSVAHLASSIIEPQIDSGVAVKAKASELSRNETDRWSRIRALTVFVQSQIVYLSLTDDTDQLAGCRPHRSAEVLASRVGDCKDKAALLVALLRSIGEDSRVLLVTLGDPGAVNPAWPSLNFNHVIVAIPADSAVPADWPTIDGGALGRLVVFDPTDTVTPLGVLRPEDQRGWALLVDAAHGELVRLPECTGPGHSEESRADAIITANGHLKAVVDKEWHGVLAAEAYANRSQIRTDKFGDQLTAQFRETVPFISNLTWNEHWDPNKAAYVVHQEFEADRYARPMGANLLAISPRIGSGIQEFPAWKTGREGVSWLSTGEVHWHVTVKIPAGFVVEELPDDWDSNGASLSSHLAYSQSAGAVSYDSNFSIKPGFYNRSRYEAIRQFIVKFHEAERRPILLKRVDPGGAQPPPPAHS